MNKGKKYSQKEQEWKDRFVWYHAVKNEIEVVNFLIDATNRHLRNNDYLVCIDDNKTLIPAKDVLIYLGEL